MIKLKLRDDKIKKKPKSLRSIPQERVNNGVCKGKVEEGSDRFDLKRLKEEEYSGIPNRAQEKMGGSSIATEEMKKVN